MVLEGRAAPLAANTLSQLQLGEIEIQSRILTGSGNAGQGQRYVAAIRGFKFAVLDAAVVPVFRDLVESLWTRIDIQFGPEFLLSRLSEAD